MTSQPQPSPTTPTAPSPSNSPATQTPDIGAFSFLFAGMPKLVFGVGRITEAATLAATFGQRVLLVTGRRSFDLAAAPLLAAFAAANLTITRCVIDQEPSPSMIDAAAALDPHAQVVIAVGGGAVIDAGKAISALLPLQHPTPRPVRDLLEGVGTIPAPGLKVPFIACPTTAGTGAEATKNAVLSEVGPQGFKKSLRHDRYIPDAVIIDPALAVACPPDVTAACGMDALTQLIEAFTSPFASLATDAFARSGLCAAAAALLPVCGPAAQDPNLRGLMAWAAFCSGVALAHAGLGVVHALASPLGGLYKIPHGVVCGALLPASTEANIRHLQRTQSNPDALRRYAEVGRLLSGLPASTPDADANEALIATLYGWCARLAIPSLCAFDVEALPQTLHAVNLRSNPAPLTRAEVAHILLRAGARLPDDATARADLCHTLSSLYFDTDRLCDAEHFARAAITAEALNPRPVIIANHWMFIVKILRARGDISEAVCCAREGLRLYTLAYGEDHGETRYVEAVLAELLRSPEQKGAE
jgi:alcohol dehydrogenase